MTFQCVGPPLPVASGASGSSRSQSIRQSELPQRRHSKPGSPAVWFQDQFGLHSQATLLFLRRLRPPVKAWTASFPSAFGPRNTRVSHKVRVDRHSECSLLVMALLPGGFTGKFRVIDTANDCQQEKIRDHIRMKVYHCLRLKPKC
jgi:hypothetical protein